MYQRELKLSNDSIFLLGPRGVGKSTWIRQVAPAAAIYDLLDSAEALRLSKDPGIFYQEVKAQPRERLVVVDEVQRVPELLNQVHRLIEEDRRRFLLSGSSARKLKRGSVNLLAGRALTYEMLPLTSAEVDTSDWKRIVHYGLLPKAYSSERPTAFLRSYVGTYLKEEIQAEALTRNIGAFTRFLEVAARQNGQVTNASQIARDAQVKRPTVDGYFSVLVDTLLGAWLPPWSLQGSNKHVEHPKFFFFDPGVARALSGRLPYEPLAEETGHLFETWIHHELRSYMTYRERHYPLSYWRTHDGAEVDFVYEGQNAFYAIEVKSSDRWDRRLGRGLGNFKSRYQEQKRLSKNLVYLGVYTGSRPLIDEEIQVLPVSDFLNRLWSDDFA